MENKKKLKHDPVRKLGKVSVPSFTLFLPSGHHSAGFLSGGGAGFIFFVRAFSFNRRQALLPCRRITGQFKAGNLFAVELELRSLFNDGEKGLVAVVDRKDVHI